MLSADVGRLKKEQSRESVAGGRFISRKSPSPELTNYIQIYRIAFNWLRRDLTVVQARVALLNPFYLQRPLVRGAVMGRLKTQVRGVCVGTDSQDM